MSSNFSRIVVAYDNSELSKKAVEVAKQLLSSNPDAEMNVITVLETYNQPYIEAHYGEILEKAREQTKTEMEKLMKEQLSNISIKTESAILEGNPAKTITDFAREKDADLIIIGSRGLGSLQGIVMGSVSSKVMQLAHCPVLVIK